MLTTQFTAIYRSPVGNLKVIGQEKGITNILFTEEDPDAIQQEASLHDHVFGCLKQLDEYFFGKRTAFDSLHLHFAATPFQEDIWNSLLEVPFGETISYGQLAVRAGHPGAARAVGTAMNQNPLPIIIPCHRVLPSDGSLGEYASGAHRKDWLLLHEQKIMN